MKILDEVYMTVNGETEKEWIIQFSSKIYKEKFGFFKSPKLFNENEKIMFFVGAAHYMFIFETKDKLTGTKICLLKDELFEPNKETEYNNFIESLRSDLLNNEN